MIRLFVALALPQTVAESLLAIQAGVPGGRWSTRDQLHLTLRFIGEVNERVAADIDVALRSASEPRFTLQLKGVGEFGGRTPRALWAGVEASEPLLHLQRKIESVLQCLGLPPEPRKFTPHVTLARLRATPYSRVGDYLRDHGLYRSAPFGVDRFVLFSSRLTPNGSRYVAEHEYPLW